VIATVTLLPADHRQPRPRRRKTWIQPLTVSISLRRDADVTVSSNESTKLDDGGGGGTRVIGRCRTAVCIHRIKSLRFNCLRKMISASTLNHTPTRNYGFNPIYRLCMSSLSSSRPRGSEWCHRYRIGLMLQILMRAILFEQAYNRRVTLNLCSV
jgi:hypothetical protein